MRPKREEHSSVETVRHGSYAIHQRLRGVGSGWMIHQWSALLWMSNATGSSFAMKTVIKRGEVVSGSTVRQSAGTDHKFGTAALYYLVVSQVVHMRCPYPERLSMTDEEVREYWKNNECHLCQNGPRIGDVDGRAALLAHYRKSKDPVHTLWRDRHYKRMIKKGGDKQDRTIYPSDVIRSIETVFPEYRVHLIKLVS